MILETVQEDLRIFSANSQMGRHGSVYDLIIETEQTQKTSYEKIG